MDDIVLLKTKPFKVFTGNNSPINDFVLKNVLATISKDKELIIFDIATTQMYTSSKSIEYFKHN